MRLLPHRSSQRRGDPENACRIARLPASNAELPAEVDSVSLSQRSSRPRRLAHQSDVAGAFSRQRVLLHVGMCLGAYLYGSLPFVYLLGRGRHVDLRAHGSGNVGAANLYAAGGGWRALIGGLGDTSKGFLPYPAARRLGCSRAVAEIATVCGLAGQCWPLFLRFRGGRGMSAFVGGACWMNPRAWAVSLAPMGVGALWRVGGMLGRRQRAARQLKTTRSRSVPLGCFVGVALFPFACLAFQRSGRPPTVAPALLAAAVLVRRLTAPLPDDATHGPTVRPEAWLFRLLFDRNTSR
jgi:hypothetical protein